eukprot:6491958-Amphidinium_carterae.7
MRTMKIDIPGGQGLMCETRTASANALGLSPKEHALRLSRRGSSLLTPKVRKVELSTYLARLPVTVQATGKSVVHKDSSVWSFHTRSLRARLHRSVLGRRRQPCTRSGFRTSISLSVSRCPASRLAELPVGIKNVDTIVDVAQFAEDQVDVGARGTGGQRAPSVSPQSSQPQQNSALLAKISQGETSEEEQTDSLIWSRFKHFRGCGSSPSGLTERVWSSPKSELEQAAVPQQSAAARRTTGSQKSPRALGPVPYTSNATSSDTVMRSPNPATTSAQPTMIVRAQQMIASIATSTGIQTETVRMTEAISARQDLLSRHLEQVPEQVAIATGWRDLKHRTRSQSHTLEEAEEIACLTAKLSCMECNARDFRI